MVSGNPKIKSHTKSLYEALTQVQRWVRNDSSCVLVAAADRKNLKRRRWPEHVKVSSVKPLGRRVAARGSRRILVAFWPDEHYQAARQPSLVCVISGMASLKMADYQLQCRMGDFIFIPQGIPMSYHSHADPENAASQCELLWVRPGEEANMVDSWICHSQGKMHESGPQYGACWVQNPMIKRLFDCLCDELQNDADAGLGYHLLTSILVSFSREIKRGKAFLPRHHMHEVREEVFSQKNGDAIAEACVYINEHLDQPLTASQVAHYVCLSPTQFHLKFQERQKQTFHQYLTRQRMAKACDLLRDTDIPINAVSSAIGVHYSQLRRLFFEHHDCSPGEFRKGKFKDK